MIFRRHREETSAADESTDQELTAPEQDDDGSADAGEWEPEAADDRSAATFDRDAGPRDISEVDEPDPMDAERIDLGAVQVPLVDGLEIRVEIDQESNTPVAVTLVRGAGAVQVRAFSGPRSGGTWADAMRDLRQQMTADGGTVDESVGPFGTELLATVNAQDEHGRPARQRVRFIGVDGPRWFLQGVLLGAGAERASAGALEELFRSLVVVRGDAAMPVGTPLPITLPQEVPGDVEAAEEFVPDDEEHDADDRA